MKEFEHIHSESLFAGISSAVEVPINAKVLYDCYNVEPTEVGLLAHQQVTSITTLGDTEASWGCGSLGSSFSSTLGDFNICWPWPQVRELENGMLIGVARIAGEDDIGLFNVHTSGGILQADLDVELGYADDILSVDISEHYGYFFVGVLYTDSTVSSWVKSLSGGFTSSVATNELPEFATSCNFNGQLIIGGLQPLVPSVWEDLGLESIAWAGVGKIEFDPTVDRTAGWLSSTYWGGTVVKLHPMEKFVVVATTQGVGILIPNSQGFSSSNAKAPGVTTARHVAGDKDVCYFIDNNCDLWMITSEGFKNLGYNHLVKYYNEEYPFIFLRWNLSFDRRNKRLYVANGTYGFVLNKEGKMYRTHQSVASVISCDDGALLGTLAETSDVEARIVTNLLDLSKVGIKTVGFLEFGGHLSGVSDAYVGVDYTYDKVSAPVEGPWVLTGPEGAGYIGITSQKFRLKFKVTDYRNLKMAIQYLNAKIKFSDKRFNRSPSNANNVIS